MKINELESFQIFLATGECGKPWEFASYMLDQVSRTFALNIKVLPQKRLGRPILLAYLYCRMADTIEDDPKFDAETKDRLLKQFSAIFSAQGIQRMHMCLAWQRELPASWNTSQDPNEFLCAHANWTVQLLDGFEAKIQAPVIACIEEMCSGMAEFAKRQESRNSAWLTIENEKDLDQYCYYVAGVVGVMLCDLFAAQSLLISKQKHAELKKFAVSFGLALQITNIIKDVGEDSLRSVCFVPVEFQKLVGVSEPEQLFIEYPNSLEIRRKVMAPMITKAWQHIDDAVRFTTLLPCLEPRIRLFCMWPLLMAAETLVAAGDGSSVFDSNTKLKITRDQVKKILRDSTWNVFSNRWLQRKVQNLKTSHP